MPQFLGDAFGDRARGDPARLGVADRCRVPAAELEADLRDLGGLARTGLTGHDDDLMGGDRRGDLVAARGKRELFGVGDLRKRRAAIGHAGFGRGDLGLDGG